MYAYVVAVAEQSKSLSEYCRWFHVMSEIFNSRTRVNSLDDPRLNELVIVKQQMRSWKENLMQQHPQDWKTRHISWQLDFDVKVTLNGSLGLIEFLLSALSP